ncbi:hypothetical protein WDU94_004566, partial [Cyamophila willieti]
FCCSEKEKEIWDSASSEHQSVASILSRSQPTPPSSDSSNNEDEKKPPVSVIKSYLNCPAAMPLYLLKRFVRNKFGAGDNDKVELIYRRESLPDYYSLMDIAYIYPWNRNEPMQFFFRIYVSSVNSNAPKLRMPGFKTLKLKVEAVDKADIPSAPVDNEKPTANMSDEKNKENLVENKITIKTEEDSNVMKPLNAPVVKVEKESPVKSCGKENKAEPNVETNKIEALQKLTDNISTMVRDESKTVNTSQSFKTPSSSSLKDIGMLTTIPIAAKPPLHTPNPTPSPSRPVSNCVRILPKPSPSSTSFTVPKSQVISVPTTMTRPTHLTIRSSLPLRPNLCSSQTASHLILSAPSMTRPVPSQTPVLFTTVTVPTTPTSHQSQVATAVSAYNNAIKQNNLIYRTNSMLLPKPRPDMQQPINQMTLVRTSTEPETKYCEKVSKANEKLNSHGKPLSRTEKVLKSAKYLNKFGGVIETGEGDGKEVRKVNAMKEYIENPRILEELEIHAAETLLQVSRNCPPKENPPTFEQQPFKRPLPVLSPKAPKSMPLISDTMTNVPPKISNVPPKIMPNGLTKKSNNTLNRKINDIKNNVDQSMKAAFDPYDFDTSSNIPIPNKSSPKRTIYSNSLSVNKSNSKSQMDSNDRKTESPKLNPVNSSNSNDTSTKNDTTKPQDSFNIMLKSNGLTTNFLSSSRNDKLDLKRSFSETERCIETEDGMLSVSLMTHDSHQHLENKKRKVEEPDVSIQLMSLNNEDTNVVKKDPKDLLKRKPEHTDQNSSNKKVCFRPKTVEHITDMLKDKKTNDHMKENGTKISPTSEKKPENVPNGLPPKITKTLPKLIEINAAPYPKTPVTKTLNIKTQQTNLENSPKEELLTALDLSPSSKSPTGENHKPKSSPKSPNNAAARSSPINNGPSRSSPPVMIVPSRSSPVTSAPARSSPVNTAPTRNSPVTVQSKSPKPDVVKPSSPPKKTSPNGTEFRSIPDLVRPEYFKMLQTQNRSNNNHLQDWYKAMSVGSIPPHPLMFAPGPDSLSKT